MKPAVVADEMFPEGAGPYMDLEEVGSLFSIMTFLVITLGLGETFLYYKNHKIQLLILYLKGLFIWKHVYFAIIIDKPSRHNTKSCILQFLQSQESAILHETNYVLLYMIFNI